MNKYIIVGLCLAGISGCQRDAEIASYNLSYAADKFEINRRIVFYNSITGHYMLVIEGLCSQEPSENKLEVTCKVGPNQYKKHFLGLSDNVTYFSEQIDQAPANIYHYIVSFKPSTIVPDIELH